VRLDGTLSLEAVQLVCSTRHVQLVHSFLAARSKLRHGQSPPIRTIRSVLEQDVGAVEDSTVHPTSSRWKDEDSSSGPMDPLDISNEDESSTLDELNRVRRCVVHSWWRYVLTAVVREVRQRQRVRILFEQKFLSLDWLAVSYQRSEYVALFIAARLVSGSEPSRRALAEEQLLALEDELPVEQILLYRSIARSVHCRGGTEMPDSILDLRMAPVTTLTRDTSIKPCSLVESSDEPGPESDDEMLDNQSTFLSMLTRQCEIARQRQAALPGEDLPAFQFLEKQSKLFRAISGEDVSFSFCSDSKTQKSDSSKQSASSTETTMKRKASGIEMALALSFQLRKLDLLLVDESDTVMSVNTDASSNSDAIGNDGTIGSDVSVLTDDECFSPRKDNVSASAMGIFETIDPIFPPSDYTSFPDPEQVIMHLTASHLSLSMRGENGGLGSLNAQIGEVQGTGHKGVELLEIGIAPSGTVPVPVIQLSSDTVEIDLPIHAPHRALVLSLRTENSVRALDCEVATVRMWLEAGNMSKLASFTSSCSIAKHKPKRLLAQSPVEDVRLFLLKQSDALRADWNGSIRMQGFEITIACNPAPKVPPPPSSMANENETAKRGPSLLLRCHSIGAYSGRAVEELFEAQMGNDSSINPGRQVSPFTLMDVEALLRLNRSLHSSHWVSSHRASRFECNLVQQS
jgi:hypothetical protein